MQVKGKERAGEAQPTRRQLLAALNSALETVVWMSGSDDFAPGGKAHAGWSKALPKVMKALAVAAKAEGR